MGNSNAQLDNEQIRVTNMLNTYTEYVIFRRNSEDGIPLQTVVFFKGQALTLQLPRAHKSAIETFSGDLTDEAQLCCLLLFKS